MTQSVFVNRGASRPTGGGGGATAYGAVIEFSLMISRDDTKAPGRPFLASLLQRQVLHGLLKWGAETYEAQSRSIGPFALAEGTYLLDGGPRRPGGSGGGRGERAGGDKPRSGGQGAQDFSLPLTLQGAQSSALSLHGPAAEGAFGITLLAADAAEFWQRWQATPGAQRPPRLRVVRLAAGGGGGGGKNPG